MRGDLLSRFGNFRDRFRSGNLLLFSFLNHFAGRLRLGDPSGLFRRAEVRKSHRNVLFAGRRVLDREGRQEKAQDQHSRKQQAAQDCRLTLVAFLE